MTEVRLISQNPIYDLLLRISAVDEKLYLRKEYLFSEDKHAKEGIYGGKDKNIVPK